MGVVALLTISERVLRCLILRCSTNAGGGAPLQQQLALAHLQQHLQQHQQQQSHQNHQQQPHRHQPQLNQPQQQRALRSNGAGGSGQDHSSSDISKWFCGAELVGQQTAALPKPGTMLKLEDIELWMSANPSVLVIRTQRVPRSCQSPRPFSHRDGLKNYATKCIFEYEIFLLVTNSSGCRSRTMSMCHTLNSPVYIICSV